MTSSRKRMVSASSRLTICHTSSMSCWMPRTCGRVQPAVDPDDGLALGGECAGLFLADALGVGEPPRDLLVPVEIRPVGGRGDGRHPLLAPLFGEADRLQRHAVRLLRQQVPVVGQPLVVDELVVGADAVAELLFGGGELGGGGGQRSRQGGEGEGGGSGRDESATGEGTKACGHEVPRGFEIHACVVGQRLGVHGLLE